MGIKKANILFYVQNYIVTTYKILKLIRFLKKLTFVL
jgi:hypothetical protein